MATYQLTSTVEFDYNFSSGLGSAAYSGVFSAFDINATPGIGNIVTVTISSVLDVANTLNAGYYSHLTDDPTGTLLAPSTFDLGYTSQAAASSYYTTASGFKSTPSAGGPSNANAGYGTLELGGTVLTTSIGSSINFNGIDNTLILDTTSVNSVSLFSSISNFQAAGDQIVFNGVGGSNATITGYSSGVLTFTNGGVSSSISFTGMAGTVASGNFTIGTAAAVEGGNSSTYAGNLVITFVPCFLSGTMIATPDGECAVESLAAGSAVIVLEAGRHVARPVRWVGGRSIRVSDFTDPVGAYPIRILRNAFADNVPHRDLLVTPEHCILTENGLTPARMLVNGASIVIDRSIGEYEFFHVELDRHGILLSEGLATESYLDGGNRRLIEDEPEAPLQRPMPVMAAPLAVARSVVEPVWARLVDRARHLGLIGIQGAVTLTDKPELRLLLDDGLELTACWHNAQRHMFRVPRGTRPLRLLSRASVPAEIVGPFVDDRRMLGVAVDQLVLWTGLDQQVLAVAEPGLRGWHGQEGDACWTDGAAELDVPVADAETFLDIHLAGTMLYPEEECLAA